MSSATPPSQNLQDLNDHQLASLTAKLRDNLAKERPLVGQLEDLEHLEGEFDSGSVYQRKVRRLRDDGWKALRRCRGDGDCFYRAFILSLLLSLHPLHPSYSAHLLAKFESLLPLLAAVGFEEMVWDDFWQPLRDLLRNLAGVERSGKRLTAEEVVEKFRDQETNSCIIVILRLITSAYLRTHTEDYSPFLFALEDDPRFFDSGAPDMKSFCERYVEAVAVEADHLPISALTRALQVPVRIAYLDQSGLPLGVGNENGGEGVGEVEVNFLEFESEALERGEKGVEGALLYRPGHYDILSR